MKPIAITPGEPAGIGPELVVRLLQSRDHPVRVYADPELMNTAAESLGSELRFGNAADQIPCVPLRLAAPVTPGRLDPRNGAYVVATLNAAVDACLAGDCAALVTAPVHKGVINDAGIPFTGHTELLAERCAADHVVMMLAAGRLRVALLTTHLPLRAVADAVTAKRLRATLQIIRNELQQRFALPQPRILVCGLNPHAGEGGHLGDEELTIIGPVIDQLRGEGFELTGPTPADSAFLPSQLEHIDAVLAMYHDQGLPVLKHAGFGHAVNITLGLPIIRTSVDHGTALDRAGQNIADPGSLLAAFDLAVSMSSGA